MLHLGLQTSDPQLKRRVLGMGSRYVRERHVGRETQRAVYRVISPSADSIS